MGIIGNFLHYFLFFFLAILMPFLLIFAILQTLTFLKERMEVAKKIKFPFDKNKRYWELLNITLFELEELQNYYLNSDFTNGQLFSIALKQTIKRLKDEQ